jgi:hypothetical protein
MSGAKDRLRAMHAAGEISDAELQDGLREFDKIIAGKIHEALLKHFDNDLGKVTAFIQTHKVPLIDDDGSGKVTVRFVPHHDDLEDLKFVLTGPDAEEVSDG